MGISLDHRIVAAPGVLSKELDGEAVLLHLDTETYFGLNETGARLWALLIESPSLRHALGRMGEEFDVEPDVLERDARRLVEEWHRLGLVSIAGE